MHGRQKAQPHCLPKKDRMVGSVLRLVNIEETRLASEKHCKVIMLLTNFHQLAV